jgi:hypothetical protein
MHFRCDGPLRTANHGSAGLARLCRFSRSAQRGRNKVRARLRRFGVLHWEPPPCPQASLTIPAVRGSLPQSGMKLAIRWKAGRRFQRLSVQRENRPYRLPVAPARPRRDPTSGASACAVPVGSASHFYAGRDPAPVLGDLGTFGRSPSVLGAIGMRPDRVDERLERSAANRSG